MDYFGYAGKVLYVDLSNGSVRKEPLDLDLAQRFIGAMGMNTRLLCDILKPGTDPFSPDSPIIIGVGPLCGTLMPGCGKCAVTYKAPAIASKNEKKHVIQTAIGGNKRFGAMLKSAGYDHVVITGQASRPSYLKIIDDTVEICDASDLWGQDIEASYFELVRRHKGTTGECGVWNIGRGGENLVRWAIAIVDGRGTLGQHGGGAVLGSKKLKAVVTLGTKGVKVADGKRFMELVDKKRKSIMAHPNFGVPYPPHGGGAISKEYPPEIYSQTKVCRSACMSCLGPEFSIHRITDGRFAGDTSELFLALVRDFGRRLRVPDYRDMMRLLNLANRAGLDIVTGARMMYFVTRLYERGIISTKETGGLSLRRGDFDCYAKLLDMIVDRKDIGDTMAEGWYPLCEKVGVDASSDFRDGCVMFKGADGQIDARFARLSPAVFSQVVQPRPHHVHQGTHYARADNNISPYYRGSSVQTLDGIKDDFRRMGTTKDEFDRIFSASDFHTGRLAKHAEDAHAVYNSLGVCDISPYGTLDMMRDMPSLAEFYSAATGFSEGPKELKLKGERIWNLQKLINVGEGFTRADDRFPPVWIQATKTPIRHPTGDLYLMDWFGRRLGRNDLHRMLDDYYDEREWDMETGIPTQEKIHDLGLEEFCELIRIASSLIA